MIIINIIGEIIVNKSDSLILLIGVLDLHVSALAEMSATCDQVLIEFFNAHVEMMLLVVRENREVLTPKVPSRNILELLTKENHRSCDFAVRVLQELRT